MELGAMVGPRGPSVQVCRDVSDALHVVQWRRVGAICVERTRWTATAAEDAEILTDLTRWLNVVIGPGSRMNRWLERLPELVEPPKPGIVLPEPEPGWCGDIFHFGALRVRRDVKEVWFRGRRIDLRPVLWRELLKLCERRGNAVALDRNDAYALREQIDHDLIRAKHGTGTYTLRKLGALYPDDRRSRDRTRCRSPSR